jgi:hypothetical protein
MGDAVPPNSISKLKHLMANDSTLRSALASFAMLASEKKPTESYNAV